MSLASQEHQVAQQQQVSPKHVKREKFLKERRLACLATVLPLLTCQFHQLKMHTKLPTIGDRLSPEPITLPPRKKSKTTFGSLVIDSKEDEE